MKANKIILNDEVLIDLTEDTVVESDVTMGKTFHKADGTPAIGTSVSEELPEYDGKYIITGTPIPEYENGMPIEVSTEEEMAAILEDATESGGVYKYMGETTETYENGALYVVEANLISFTIDGTTYQAVNGMTWKEWVKSDYNTVGLTIDGNSRVCGSNGWYLCTNAYALQMSIDTITDGGSYILSNPLS